jgi:outer membrane protein OmpA-like peptidoglycan-associated protein
VTSDRPAVDLEIGFKYNSHEITDDTRPVVMALGKTLTSDTLKGESFMVAGHTDGKGSAGYNQALSERRAQAVKDFLLANFPLKDEQLMVVGYGMEKLKDKKNRYADVNRRVEVVNISPSVAMSRN